MTTRAYIVGDSPVILWGLSSRERLTRQIEAIPGVELAAESSAPAGAERVLVLRADYLFEVRTLTELMSREGVLAYQGQPAAAHVAAEQLDATRVLLGGEADDTDNAGSGEPATGLEHFEVEALGRFVEELRRAEPPTLARLSEASRDALTNQLYGSAYRGITDLVTKFWWPRPARRVVAWCADRRITPNAVTLTGLVLMLIAGWCFYQGWYASGLAAGWIMTFLDTVDGKLARVTVMSSKIGHWLDHGMDIIHPPFWYWLWGLGLAAPPSLWGFDATVLYVAMFLGYLGGRIAEGLFYLLGSLSLFTWRPFDAYFRLITGRRNPSLILLTVFALMGRPDWGFLSVVIWTVVSTAVLLLRYLQGLAVRQHTGEPLSSWMEDPEVAAAVHPQAFRTFSSTRSAYGA